VSSVRSGPHPPSAPAATAPTGMDVVAFAAPALLAFELALTGRLFLTELILLASLPFLAVGRIHVRLDRATTVIVVFGLLWLWGQMVTDIARETPLVDFARGWLKIFFTLSTLLALALICTTRRRITLFATGAVVGLVTQYLFSPDPLALAHPWKFGLGFPFTVLFALAASHTAVRNVAFLPAALLGTAALINLAQGFRSLAGICFLASAYLVLQHLTVRRRGQRVSASLTRSLGLAGIMAVFAIAFLHLYGEAAERGMLGAKAAQKQAYQSSGQFGSVIVGGRPTIVIGARAIRDSPVVGHGSWARDPKYASEGVAELVSSGYAVDPSITSQLLQRDEIPSHSYLLGAWVEGGILGGAFWIVVLGYAAGAFFNFHRIEEPLAPLVVFFLVVLSWNIFFSPYGAEQRIFAPYAIVLMLYARKRISEERARAVSALPDQH
jgi:hypothetical protein